MLRAHRRPMARRLLARVKPCSGGVTSRLGYSAATHTTTMTRPSRQWFHTRTAASRVVRRGFCTNTGVAANVESQPQLPDDDVSPERNLPPSVIVSELDKYIIGQTDAKRAVAIALRNRWRRQRVEQPLRDEIIPKNILMIGPTGVGKTEVARRLAKLVDAPFIKVEATKFTEVGYHGRDVDQIIRDLSDISFQMAKRRETQRLQSRADDLVNEVLLSKLLGTADAPNREAFREMLIAGDLEDREVEVEVVASPKARSGLPPPMQEMLRHFSRGMETTTRKKLTVAAARPLLRDQQIDKMVNEDALAKEAVRSVEEGGIVFIDEIDKICSSQDAQYKSGDPSSEGVQRDLLPIIEGSIINTKHGNIDTSKILFIASGAFHSCKPSDLLAELQGRLPIRVELKPLNQKDLYRILTETESNLVLQQCALLATEGIELEFSENAVKEIAKVASEVNEQIQNIGARRLHTIIERIVEDISFNCEKQSGKVIVDSRLVKERLGDMLLKTDLSRFVL